MIQPVVDTSNRCSTSRNWLSSHGPHEIGAALERDAGAAAAAGAGAATARAAGAGAGARTGAAARTGAGAGLGVAVGTAFVLTFMYQALLFGLLALTADVDFVGLSIGDLVAVAIVNMVIALTAAVLVRALDLRFGEPERVAW